MENKEFTGPRCRLRKRYHAIPPGDFGRMESDPPAVGLVLVKWNCGYIGLMYRHEIEVMNGIDEVYVENEW